MECDDARGTGWWRRVGRAGLDLLPTAVLAVAAVVPSTRSVALPLLALGAILAARHDRRRWPAWAAAIPVAVSLAWALAPLPPSARDGSTCGSLLAPFALYRLVEAALGLGMVLVLARWLRADAHELGLRRPTPRAMWLGLAGLALCGPAGVVLGPTLAAPFFGPFALGLDDLGAIVPAMLFALSNGIMEEVIYRGSMRAWTGRVTGPAVAVIAQAIVFGLAHSGPGFVGSPVPVALAMTAGGLIAGLIVWRTGSLFIPIAVHVGLDIPLYYGNACRIP